MHNQLTDIFTLTKRHTKLYFKDKQNFIMSLLSPLILVVLFITFLKSVYASSLLAALPQGMTISDNLVNSFTAGWLISSILGVTSVTLAFCSNTIVITDKINGCIRDMEITPTKKLSISLSYFISNFFTTFLICFICLVFGLGYMSIYGWYLTINDIVMIVLNLILCVSFGSLLASIVESFISSQGGASAVATLISSMYGFVCGAYMPISQFSTTIANVISCLPGTYGTVIFRNYFMHGIIDEMAKDMPVQAVGAIRDAFDNNIYFFGTKVELPQMFAILGISVVVLLLCFSILVVFKSKKK